MSFRLDRHKLRSHMHAPAWAIFVGVEADCISKKFGRHSSSTMNRHLLIFLAMIHLSLTLAQSYAGSIGMRETRPCVFQAHCPHAIGTTMYMIARTIAMMLAVRSMLMH